MAMQVGLLGKKIGMTQVFAADGERIPVTVIRTGPCVVVGKRTADKDGYTALIIGAGEKRGSLVNKPEMGAFKKANVAPQQFVRELRMPDDELAKYEIGQEVKASTVFEAGAPIDVEGISKGKGFQGVFKKHHMKGMKNTHGTHEFFRHGGSIGCRLTPGRVHKGKRMNGQMGNEVTTVQNLELFRIVEEDNCILVRGSVPGATGGWLTITKAATRDKYKLKGRGIEETRSKNPLKASKKAAAGR
jgi:large subunit ribosomal protein L3